MADAIEELLAEAEDPAYVRIVVARVPFVRQELKDRRERLDAELQAALLAVKESEGIGDVSVPAGLAEQVVELEAEIEESKREFRFRSIGYRAWADLLRAHPPTKEQAKATPSIDHNAETFPAAAIAASCSDPVMTVEQAQRLIASPVVDVMAWNELWSACLRANVHEPPGKSRAAGTLLRLNGVSAQRHTTIASPVPFSSDE